jgi:hypothetical protein
MWEVATIRVYEGVVSFAAVNGLTLNHADVASTPVAPLAG